MCICNLDLALLLIAITLRDTHFVLIISFLHSIFEIDTVAAKRTPEASSY